MCLYGMLQLYFSGAKRDAGICSAVEWVVGGVGGKMEVMGLWCLGRGGLSKLELEQCR